MAMGGEQTNHVREILSHELSRVRTVDPVLFWALFAGTIRAIFVVPSFRKDGAAEGIDLLCLLCLLALAQPAQGSRLSATQCDHQWGFTLQALQTSRTASTLMSWPWSGHKVHALAVLASRCEGVPGHTHTHTHTGILSCSIVPCTCSHTTPVISLGQGYLH